MGPIKITSFTPEQSERVLELNDNLQRAMTVTRQAEKTEDSLREAEHTAARVTAYAQAEARHAQAVVNSSYLASL